MIDSQPTPIPASIDRLVARVRRRLRAQAALAVATHALILAVAASLVVLWLWRMDVVSSHAASMALIGAGVGVVLAAIVGSFGKLPAQAVAARLDRASGLADRLGTAVDFSRRLGDEQHPDTLAFMQAAIADGIAAAPRANVKAASPWRAPRDLGALGVFASLAIVIALLAFGPTRHAGAHTMLAAAATVPNPADEESLDPDDLAYQRQFVDDMKKLAEETQDRDLQQFALDLKALLDKAEKGEISKQDLLTQMDALEKNYMKGSSVSTDSVVAQLKDQGKELKKNLVTKRLGEALEAGDLEAAQKELDRLAEQIQKGEMKKEDQQKLADALDKAAEKQQQEQKKDEADAEQKLQKKEDEVRKLEKKVADEPKNEEARRTLQKEQRELEKLEREKKDQAENQPKRQLERLSRDMKKSAESLRQKNQNQQDQDQQNQKSAENMKNTAQDSKKMQNELQKHQNQQKVQSKLGDLKEAIRRAKPRKGNGQGRSEQARSQRIKEWEQRANGGRGDPQAWRQSLGQGQPGQQGKPGQSGQQGQEGQSGQNNHGGELGGQKWGDEHDPNMTGDPTQLNARKVDEQLTGVQGKGESRRETVLTAAKKGFASTKYKDVYASYQKIVEEVMNSEKVPQGYKYYVKRYFQRIKPHSMDD